MTNEKVFQMDFGKVYELLLNKAVKKGRTQTEVDEVICWLTGYNTESLEKALTSSVCYGVFFSNAPAPNPNRTLYQRPGGGGGGSPISFSGRRPQPRHKLPLGRVPENLG